MKNIASRHLPLALILGATLVAASPLAQAQGNKAHPPTNPNKPAAQHSADTEELHASSEEGTTVRTKFSDSSKPGTLKLSLPWAEVHITGTDGNEVLVTSTLAQKGKGEVDDEGFRRLDEEVSFELTEKNNVATIVVVGDNPWASHDAQFDIKVPRNTNLFLQTETGGDISVERVGGEIDINSMNGEVTLIEPGSSAVVNTMNGEINAVFKAAPTKPISLSSMNGEIALTLPSETKANLRIRSHNGSIRTNFPDTILQSKNENRTADSDVSDADRARSQRDVDRAMRDAEKAMADAEKAAARAMADAQKASEQAVADAHKAAVAAMSATPAVAGTPMPAPAPIAPRAPRAPRAPHIPMPPFGGKSIVGTLNGGGIDIQLATMNGSITLRQAK
ncbi:MAG TPA: DUF4097 family beta strand repeat-containing protein [Candidatus Didemnitutus sp.]|nr:DUF4097 family beta strand repeat-containing protein [Candidatus Didemnitutus sp.]